MTAEAAARLDLGTPIVETDDPRVVILTAPGRPELQLTGCVCGALVWDIDAHWRAAHPTGQQTLFDP